MNFRILGFYISFLILFIFGKIDRKKFTFNTKKSSKSFSNFSVMLSSTWNFWISALSLNPINNWVTFSIHIPNNLHFSILDTIRDIKLVQFSTFCTIIVHISKTTKTNITFQDYIPIPSLNDQFSTTWYFSNNLILTSNTNSICKV